MTFEARYLRAKREDPLSQASYEVQGAVAVVTMDAAGRMVTIGPKMREAVREGFSRAIQDPAIRAIVLTSVGKSFCVGNDLSWLESEKSRYAAIRDEMDDVVQFLQLPSSTPKPVIAAVNGYALGGGLELASGCDMIVAAESAQFGMPEIKLGMTPSFAARWLPDLIGVMRARQLLFSGEQISAETALDWGLVNSVVADDKVLTAALELAERLASFGPVGLRMLKEGINRRLTDIDYVISSSVNLFFTSDGQEGINAFLEKRAAVFKGE